MSGAIPLPLIYVFTACNRTPLGMCKLLRVGTHTLGQLWHLEHVLTLYVLLEDGGGISFETSTRLRFRKTILTPKAIFVILHTSLALKPFKS